MIKQHNISERYGKKDEQQIRIWQKIYFGKIEIPLDSDFWKYEIKEMEVDYYSAPKLWVMGEVFEKDNTRYIMISENTVLEITPDDTLYNYIDKGRKVLLDRDWFIFNNLEVDEQVVKDFAKYEDRRKLDLTKLSDSEVENKVFIFYDEDIKQMKTRLKEIKKEANEEKKKELLKTDETVKVKEFLKDYQNLKIIEDKQKKIENNTLYDKENKVKLVFTRKIIDLFSKEELFEPKYNLTAENFIKLDHKEILGSLVDKFNFYDHKEEETMIWYKINPKRFTFKIYQLVLNNETDNEEEETDKKENWENVKEKFLLDFSFKAQKGKCYWKYFIDDVKIPKQKVSRAIRKLTNRWYGEGLVENALTFDTYLKNMKKYSQMQLEVLEKGLSDKIEFENARLPFKITITNPQGSIWRLKFDKHIWDTEYPKIKHINRRGARNVLNLVNLLGEATNEKTERLEDLVIEFLQKRRKEIEVFEKRAKKLWEDTIMKHKERIIIKDNKIIIKGKLKSYRLQIQNDDVKVYTYPENNYLCIHANTKEGHELYIHDKLTQFALALLNDSNMREQIHTLS